jgi:hypothetical protein
MSVPNPYAPPQSALLSPGRVGRPRRTIMAWRCRYMLAGAFIGLLLPLFIFPSTIPPIFIMPFCGAVVGTVIGCLGGVVEHLMKSGVKQESGWSRRNSTGGR